MKCELAAALLHRPTTLFLDEPTIGLDVAMQVAIRDFVRSYNQRHEATVLLTSHYMDDVVALCPRIIVIDQGTLIHDGDLRQLIKTMDPDKRVSFTLTHAIAEDELVRLGTLLVRDGQRITLRVTEREVPHVIGHLLGTLKAADLAIEDPPLEDILRVMFGKRKHPPAEPS
jgi:ABC-2 type transport system ATP-binding protein